MFGPFTPQLSERVAAMRHSRRRVDGTPTVGRDVVPGVIAVC